MPTNETYSNILRRTAKPWGVMLRDGMLDDEDVPRPAVVEKLEWHGKHGWQWCNVELVTLNGLWSFAASFSISGVGSSFGPYLKFCEPVNTREEALARAVAWLKCQGAVDDRTLACWLEQLQPLQMSLL